MNGELEVARATVDGEDREHPRGLGAKSSDVEAAPVPTPSAKSTASKTPSSSQGKVVEAEGTAVHGGATDAADAADAAELSIGRRPVAEEKGGDSSEPVGRLPSAPAGPATTDTQTENKRTHSRQGSFRKHAHSRNPSDVCPRVAVIATQEEEENVCSICLDEFSSDDPIAETQCGHGYHLQCIMQWAQRSQECPLCFSQLVLADEGMNALLPFGEYSSPQDEQAMTSMIENMEFETFLIHLAAAERRQERQQRRQQRQEHQEREREREREREHGSGVRRRHSEDGGHVVMPSGSSEGSGSAVGSPIEETSVLKSVRRGLAAFFRG